MLGAGRGYENRAFVAVIVMAVTSPACDKMDLLSVPVHVRCEAMVRAILC